MATTTKVGPCRIPTFSSRIPQISSAKSHPVAPLPSPSPEPELSKKHLGKKVRVGEKEGVLKYVGSVHFAKGGWCGIELTNAVGKNDGIVNGVRYFACSKLRGLMAPLSKVTLIEGSCESLHEDNASGPYSILCLDPKLPDSTFSSKTNVNQCDNTTNCTYNLEKDNQNCQKDGGDNNLEQHCKYDLENKTTSVDNLSHIASTEKTFNKRDTFDIQNNAKSTEDLRRLVLKEKTVNKNCSHTSINSIGSDSNDDKQCKDSTTYELKYNRACSIENIPSNQSYVFEKSVNATYGLQSRRDLTISAENLSQTRINLTQTIHSREIITDPITPHELPNNAISIENLICPLRRNTYEIDNFKEENLLYLTNLKKRTSDTFTHDNDLDIDSENTLNCKKVKSPLTEALPYFPINKSCEDLLNESTIEVKRRRTSNPKCYKAETSSHRHLPLDKPSSLPQLRSSHHLNGNGTPSNSLLNLQKLNHSTPIRGDIFEDLRKLRLSGINVAIEKDDDNNKRDSLDCEESLGILTPDQMADFAQTRSPSLEYNPLLGNNKLVLEEKLLSPSVEVNKRLGGLTIDTYKVKDSKEEVQSPNLTSATENSLGIIDADLMASTFNNLKTDTTMNLDLPLDSLTNNNKEFTLTRCDQTPSPEELPLDTTPIVESEPSKTESTAKSKTSNSFITSITSITSLDTGYQGDGEMSRPASRGADNSPLTRRPFPRPQPRRPDPMTDSDFYTESDADNHEDNQLKGDRRAQVIDGTLYGVDPQAAADIYVNNRENMDSSGVFTDIESGLRNDDEIENDHDDHDHGDDNDGHDHGTDPQRINIQTADVSPSDSSKTISENSQSNLQEILQKTVDSTEIIDSSLDKTIKENPKKRNAPSPGISSPSSLSSPRHQKEENAAKKYKMPKRDVASKVKAMLEPNQSPPSEKKSVKKPVNRWDAVMNKISKNEQNKTNLKEIKSKVFEGVNLSNSPTIPRNNEQRKPNVRPLVNQNNKSRRVRTRTSHNSVPLKKLMGSNIESSIHSSLSDLSASTIPPKKSPGSAKKRDAIQVTQVLTPNKITSRNQQTLTENKKNANNINASSSTESKTKRTIFPSKEKKQQILVKESNKPTVKGGRTSPSVRPPAPQTPRAPAKRAPPAPRAAEALAVLVQHLVFNVEAYQVPYLRRQVEKFRLEAEEIRLAYQHLEEILTDEKLKQTAAIEEERVRCRNDITELIEKHRYQIAQLTSQYEEGEQQLKLEKDTAQQYLTKKHEEQLATVRQELEKLQRSHEEALDILREENESIREQIDEKRSELEKVNHESLKLKQDYECKEIKLKEEVEIIKLQRDKFKLQIEQLERDFQEKLKSFMEENKRLREENDRLLSYGDDKDIGMQEVQSLRVVLELKQNEVADLRKTLGQVNQKLEILTGAEERASALQARCEDLQHQLQRKNEYEQTLIQENHKLNESFKEEVNQKRRLSQYNEELQWKLRQNKEVITKVMEQAEESVFNRSNIYSSSFNEKHNASKLNLERTLSFRDSSYSNKSNSSLDGSSRGRKSKNSIDFDDDLSPPSSPKVKGVVEKSDSVSYVLDLDESPEVVASRIVRRSFRNTTPPKNTPTKSPSNKRPRIRNPLSMSASSSSIIPLNKEECERPRSASARNGNCDDDDVFLWANPQSTPRNYDGDKLTKSCRSSHSSMKLDDNLELDEDNEDLPLPALPNEMDKRNGVLALPSPKRLAGDAAASDSNSEDESTSSSQL